MSKSNLNRFSNKIIELLRFYKIYKDSISQVFQEKYSNDHRLGYILYCIANLDPILPILEKISNDGTLYLKEYRLKEG